MTYFPGKAGAAHIDSAVLENSRTDAVINCNINIVVKLRLTFTVLVHSHKHRCIIDENRHIAICGKAAPDIEITE